MLVGLAVIEKSLWVRVTVALWVRDPLDPVTVMVKVPAVVVLTLRVEVADPPAINVTLVGLSVEATPAGDEVAVSDTVPVKPFRLVTVIVDV
jgi:hypothetical protein